jgi:serine/threonine-protein kinase
MRRPGQTYAFGDFRLDARRRVLTQGAGGQAVALPGLAFDTLLHLVEHAGEVVERSALLDAVWPNVTVVENSVSQMISVLRRALGDDPGAPRFVVTAPRRGYRFAAEVAVAGGDVRDPVAYQLYVTALAAVTRPGAGKLEAALRGLEEAIVRDPEFALAHLCIADCNVMLGIHDLSPPLEVFRKAQAAVRRALEIDADLAEAYAVVGQLAALCDSDFAGSEAALARALELDPQCFRAHRFRGMQMIIQGRHDEALASLRRAQAIQPLAVHINGNIGMAWYYAGRYDEAIAQLEHTLRMDEHFEVARGFLGHCFLQLGAFDRAIEQFERSERVGRGRAGDLPSAYALSGRTREARDLLSGLLREADSRYVPPYEIATIYAALQDDANAMVWLEHAVAARNLHSVTVDPMFRRLHTDPRFARLMEVFVDRQM